MKTVLIVEDDENIAAGLEIRFKANGYSTLLAHDALQATRLGVQRKPDLILLDISLPAGSGLTVAENLNKLVETKDIPIIFVTASRDPQLCGKVAQLNGAGFFEKPYDFDDLLAGIRHTLQESTMFPKPSNLMENNQAKRTKARAEKILIVEDDPNIAMALALRLKAAGYETMLAFDALLGLSSAVRTPPDLVLLDISMPAGDGLGLAEKIQGLLPQPPPIIFLTASKQPALRQRARELGAAGFFEKPYEAEELMAAIKKALEAAQQP